VLNPELARERTWKVVRCSWGRFKAS